MLKQIDRGWGGAVISAASETLKQTLMLTISGLQSHFILCVCVCVCLLKRECKTERQRASIWEPLNMHDMFSGRQAGVAIATGVGHKPGGDGIFDWLSGDRRDHSEGGVGWGGCGRTERDQLQIQSVLREIWLTDSYRAPPALEKVIFGLLFLSLRRFCSCPQSHS